MLAKLYGNNIPNITKPECYGFYDNSLFLCTQVHPLSLETIIQHHKRIGSSIHATIIYSFGWKLYDIINKIKNSGSDLFHRNLKPSNIFYHIVN